MVNSTKEKLITPEIFRFIKFGIVGGSGIFVNMGVLWILTELIGLYYIYSSIIAILLAMINNFIWNDLWTWKDRGKPGIKAYLSRLIKFCIVSSIAGYGGNLGTLWILTHFFHLYYLLSNLIGIGVGTVLNYTLNDFWTFRIGIDECLKD